MAPQLLANCIDYQRSPPKRQFLARSRSQLDIPAYRHSNPYASQSSSDLHATVLISMPVATRSAGARQVRWVDAWESRSSYVGTLCTCLTRCRLCANLPVASLPQLRIDVDRVNFPQVPVTVDPASNPRHRRRRCTKGHLPGNHGSVETCASIARPDFLRGAERTRGRAADSNSWPCRFRRVCIY
ncbi:hypothetical protein LMG27177_06867 [Paraburkholderia fynbosensis]|uniref:Uncharacterized protein n=1 Tax=Paraburkholderia fynbosensis TaxID=1200993 RepID=A0A6J5H2L9_9BURK|nr:hypothetical protein LMG27177_06867 [Paraburkholderia fynbosensis]